jgi:hypothetical protein
MSSERYRFDHADGAAGGKSYFRAKALFSLLRMSELKLRPLEDLFPLTVANPS